MEPNITNNFTKESDVAAAITAIRTAERSAVHDVENPSNGRDKRYALVPKDHALHEFSFENDRPFRESVNVNVHTLAGFIEYVKKYMDANSAVFSDVKRPAFTAILDYHEVLGGDDDVTPVAPRWGFHRCTYGLPLTPEWQAWVNRSNQPFEQARFAEFIEDNAQDVAEDSPASAAALIEMARNLSLKQGVEFRSALNAANGTTQLQYVETIEGETNRGAIRIPERFALSLAPFIGGAAVRIDARLRYRLASGKVTFHFVLDRPECVLREQFGAMRKEVRDTLAELLVIDGEAPGQIA